MQAQRSSHVSEPRACTLPPTQRPARRPPPPGSSALQIQAAFRGLALKHHPDRYSSEADKKAATTRFQGITAAYQVRRLLAGVPASVRVPGRGTLTDSGAPANVRVPGHPRWRQQQKGSACCILAAANRRGPLACICWRLRRCCETPGGGGRTTKGQTPDGHGWREGCTSTFILSHMHTDGMAARCKAEALSHTENRL